MNVEGLIINKTPYKERDLICQLLLRTGNVLSIYFYGGRGGGKNLKGSILEIGHMIKIELTGRKKKIESDLHMAKEYQLVWAPNAIRLNFKAYYLSIFFMEYISKIALQEDIEFDNGENQGLFNVLSNGLFYLDKACANAPHLSNHLFFYFTKLCIHLGVVPGVDHCLYCDCELKNDLVYFDVQDGGFSCLDCSSKKDEFLSENKNLLSEYQSSLRLKQKLKAIFKLNYSLENIESLDVDMGMCHAMFNYINYQFGFSKDQFRTWSEVSHS